MSLKGCRMRSRPSTWGGTAYHVQNKAVAMVRGAKTVSAAYYYPDPVLATPSGSRHPDCK